MTTRKAKPRMRSKRTIHAQTTSAHGLVAKRKDGSIYHQDRLRWDSSALGTFRYPTHEIVVHDDG